MTTRQEVEIDPVARELLERVQPDLRELITDVFAEYRITPIETGWEFQRAAVALVLSDDDDLYADTSRKMIEVDPNARGVIETFFGRVGAIRALRKHGPQIPLTRAGCELWLDARGITDPDDRERWIDLFTDRLAERGRFRESIAELEELKLLHPARLDPGFARAYLTKRPLSMTRESFVELVRETQRMSSSLFLNYLRRHRQDLYPLLMWPVLVAQEAERQSLGLRAKASPADDRKLDDEIAQVKVLSRHLRRLVAERDQELGRLVDEGLGPSSDEYRRVKNLFDVRVQKASLDDDE